MLGPAHTCQTESCASSDSIVCITCWIQIWLDVVTTQQWICVSLDEKFNNATRVQDTINSSNRTATELQATAVDLLSTWHYLHDMPIDRSVKQLTLASNSMVDDAWEFSHTPMRHALHLSERKLLLIKKTKLQLIHGEVSKIPSPCRPFLPSALCMHIHDDYLLPEKTNHTRLNTQLHLHKSSSGLLQIFDWSNDDSTIISSAQPDLNLWCQESVAKRTISLLLFPSFFVRASLLRRRSVFQSLWIYGHW
jgi:hypothetical protein